MVIKITPGITRSNSLPLMRPSSSPSSSLNQAKSPKTSAGKARAELRLQILANMASLIEKQYYRQATIYTIKNANNMTITDITSIKDILSKKIEHKHTREKVIEWVKYYVGSDPKAQSADINLHNLYEELEKQIKIKLQKERDIITNELAMVRSFGISDAEYLVTFSAWLKGKNLGESQANITQWRKFIEGCQQVKAQNERALITDGPLIAFQGLHPMTTNLFMELTSNMQRSQAMLAEPKNYTKMNELITSCIDRVAPDPSSDVDSYTSLHEPNDGPASRIIGNVSDLARTIFNGPAWGQKWYLELIKHGSQWHIRGSNPVLNQSAILQSFEWQRNDDQSLTRKIAMTTYQNPHIKTHSISLNINKILAPHFTESTEGIALRLLQRMANTPAEDQGKFFDDWLSGLNHATPHDEELYDLLTKNPQLAQSLKTDFLSFLKTSSEVHTRFIYDLSGRAK